VPGDTTLRIVLANARAHDDQGRATVDLNRRFGLPVVLATRGAGDFEGVVTLGVGQTRKAAFQVRRYSNPGRLVVDITTRAVLPAARCLYLVRGLQHTGDLYVGGFVVARLDGSRMTGTVGDFYSEFAELRGTVSADRTRLQVRDGGGTWQPWSQRWLAKKRTLAGWLPVTRAQMREYSGGGVPLAGHPCG
jgi:hypothetical protein